VLPVGELDRLEAAVQGAQPDDGGAHQASSAVASVRDPARAVDVDPGAENIGKTEPVRDPELLHRAEIRLDGNAIWDSGEKPLVDELIKVSERPIKPGPHTVTVKMEVRPGKKGEKEHADLGYESEHTFVVQVPDAKTTIVALTADDDGDLPEYEPEVELELKTEK